MKKVVLMYSHTVLYCRVCHADIFIYLDLQLYLHICGGALRQFELAPSIYTLSIYIFI